MKKYEIRRPWDKISCPHPGGGKSMTKQSFSEECDINVINRKYIKTGQVPYINVKTPLYGDFTSADEFQRTLERVEQAEQLFDKLPPAVKRRVHHDPAEYIEFCTNPENLAELRELGLAEAPAEGNPPQVEAVESPGGEVPPPGEPEEKG